MKRDVAASEYGKRTEPKESLVFDSWQFHEHDGFGRKMRVSFQVSVAIAAMFIPLGLTIAFTEDPNMRTILIPVLVVFPFLLYMLKRDRERYRQLRNSLARLSVNGQGITMSECYSDAQNKWCKFFPFESIERIEFVRLTHRGSPVGFDLVMRGDQENASVLRERSEMKVLVKILKDLRPELCEFKRV